MKGYSALLVINVFIVVKWNAVLATESRSRIRRTKPFQSISSDSIMNNWVTNSGELNEKMNYGVEQRKAKLSLGAHNERDVKYIQHQYDNRVRSEKESNARRENTAKVYEKKRSQKIQSGRSKTKLKTTVRHSESNQRQNDDSSSPIGNKGSNDKENNGGNLNSKLEDSIMYNPLISFDDSAVDQVHEREKHTKPDFDNLDEISRLFLDEIFAFMSMATLPPTPSSVFSDAPTSRETDIPSVAPTLLLITSDPPTESMPPSSTKTQSPSLKPSDSPVGQPSIAPSPSPRNSDEPSSSPTEVQVSSDIPTVASSATPINDSSDEPSPAPIIQPIVVVPSVGPPTKVPVSEAPAPGQLRFCDANLTRLKREELILAIVNDITPEATILKSGTAQNKAFRWLINEDEANVCPEDMLDVYQRYIMSVVYFLLGGDRWRRCNAATSSTVRACPRGNERYLSGENVCLWYNVNCDSENGTIADISLDNNFLAGSIPSELSFLTKLETIDLDRNNRIQGNIPPSLGKLGFLRSLHVNASSLTGPLPEQLCGANALEQIDLRSNKLGSTIPSCLSQLESLGVLALDNNNFTGTLPSELGQIDSLRVLSINDNTMSGRIPGELGNNTNLMALSLQENRFNGTIPKALGNLSNLKTLNLFSNFLTGTVPTELATLRSMEGLFLHFNELTGTMPPEICALGLKQLTADCGIRGRIECEQPACCTACF